VSETKNNIEGTTFLHSVASSKFDYTNRSILTKHVMLQTKKLSSSLISDCGE